MPERVRAFRDARASNNLGLMLGLVDAHGDYLAGRLTQFEVAGVIVTARLVRYNIDGFMEAACRFYSGVSY